MIARSIPLLILGVLWASVADAVLIAGGDGSQNTSSPVGGQGWDYVGRIDKSGVYSSVTYISNNWFITAYHVKQLDNPTAVLIGGSSYAIYPGSWTRLKNSAAGNADLVMFRVAGDVELLGLVPSSSPIPVGSSVTMIGNGRNREAGITYWDASWAEVGPPGLYSGFKWASGATKRWGTNEKSIATLLWGSTDMFYTLFDQSGGDNEAQGVTYDSGGGVFYNNGGQWELTGIMLGVDGYAGQPSSTSLYGNKTWIADISVYAEQIKNIASVPEPTVLAYLSGVPIMYLLYYRVRKVASEKAEERSWASQDECPTGPPIMPHIAQPPGELG